MLSQANERSLDTASIGQLPVDDGWQLECASVDVLSSTQRDDFDRIARTSPVLVDARACWPRDANVLSLLTFDYGHLKLNEVRTIYGFVAQLERSQGLNPDTWARVRLLLDSWTISDYVDAASAGDAPFYLANLALAYLPEIAKRYSSPEVGPRNLLRLFERARAPELFVGSSNTRYSNLHVDAMGGSVWCVCLAGEKEWVVFPPEDSKNLCPFRMGDLQIRHSLLDPWNQDMCARFPLGSLHPYRVRLQPGQALFLPPNWWHVTRNHGLTVTINERLWSWKTLRHIAPALFHELQARVLPGTPQPYVLY